MLPLLALLMVEPSGLTVAGESWVGSAKAGGCGVWCMGDVQGPVLVVHFAVSENVMCGPLLGASREMWLAKVPCTDVHFKISDGIPTLGTGAIAWLAVDEEGMSASSGNVVCEPVDIVDSPADVGVVAFAELGIVKFRYSDAPVLMSMTCSWAV